MVASIDYLNETWNASHNERESHSPTADSTSSGDMGGHHRYSAVGSPAAGTRRVLDEGSSRLTWWQLWKPTGEQTGGSMGGSSGMPERVTTWPMESNWQEDGGFASGVWTLGTEGVAWTVNNASDLFRIGFGAVDIVLGVGYVTGTGGLGAAAGGGLLVAVGLDQMIAGVRNIANGRSGPGFSLLERFVYNQTGSELLAVLTPAIASMGLSRIAQRGLTLPAASSSRFLARIEAAPGSLLPSGGRASWSSGGWIMVEADSAVGRWLFRNFGWGRPVPADPLIRISQEHTVEILMYLARHEGQHDARAHQAIWRWVYYVAESRVPFIRSGARYVAELDAYLASRVVEGVTFYSYTSIPRRALGSLGIREQLDLGVLGIGVGGAGYGIFSWLRN